MKTLALILLSVLLTACQDAPSTYVPAPFAFENSAISYRLASAKIKLVEDYKSLRHAPNIEHYFAVTPAQAVKKWASKRLHAAGQQGVFELTINDASVKEIKLPKTKGVSGLFRDDQEARYDARLSVSLRLFDGTQSISVATADIQVTRSRTVNEKATAVEREQIQHQMVEDLMTDFDREADQRLHRYFSAFLQ